MIAYRVLIGRLEDCQKGFTSSESFFEEESFPLYKLSNYIILLTTFLHHYTAYKPFKPFSSTILQQYPGLESFYTQFHMVRVLSENAKVHSFIYLLWFVVERRVGKSGRYRGYHGHCEGINSTTASYRKRHSLDQPVYLVYSSLFAIIPLPFASWRGGSKREGSFLDGYPNRGFGGIWRVGWHWISQSQTLLNFLSVSNSFKLSQSLTVYWIFSK